MKKSSLKALYLFLTAILGIILLLMLHRALFVIYDLLALVFPELMVFNIDPALLRIIDFTSLLFAVFIGGWYGVWLGLHWFEIVYEEHGSHRKLFHGFLPHNWRRHKVKRSEDNSHSENPVRKHPKKIVMRSSSNQQKPFSTFRRSLDIESSAWGFDDLISAVPTIKTKDTESEPEEKEETKKSATKKTAKKKTAKKATKKTAKKKTTKSKSE